MMKKIYFGILFAAVLITSGQAFAQIQTPAPSPGTVVTATVGLTDIEVDYSRPGMKDRVIFGDLVPYGEIWRTGANKATSINFEDPVTFAGNTVEPGKYSIFTIPGKSEWTIIINSNTELWGAGDYKESEDVVRFTVKPTSLKDAVETFTIDFGHFTMNEAHLIMSWEKTSVHIPIKVDVDAKVETQIREQIMDKEGEEIDARTYHAAASYYLEKGKNLDQALKWETMAVEGRPEAFWYIHAQARIYAALGKKKEAIAAAEKSLKMAQEAEGGDFGYIKRNEDLIKSLK